MSWGILIMERLDELKKLREKANEKGNLESVREIDTLIATNIHMFRGSDEYKRKGREKNHMSEVLFEKISESFYNGGA